MAERAHRFHTYFHEQDWVLDIGIGYGWHWAGITSGAHILGIDLSFGNLQVAKRLVRDPNRVAFVCADAAALPIRAGAVSGVWSVQAFQHFPESVLKSAVKEIDRALAERFAIEIYNLNPAWLQRIVYRMAGKRMHRHGRSGEIELNRFSAREWADIWQDFRHHTSRKVVGYSELFFHPDLRFIPKQYPLFAEHVLRSKVAWLAGLFARQVHIRVESQG
jgi:ubiquinone/menaquinone biosynthesis C-methylase UbiE